MTSITVEYTGDGHCRSIHGPSGQAITTDLPRDNGGKGEFFSPTDLIPTSLATCILTIMAKVGQRRDLDLAGIRADVVKEMVADPDRRIGSIRTVVHMPGGLDEKDQTILERAALTCPVHRSISSGIDLQVEFRYGE